MHVRIEERPSTTTPPTRPARAIPVAAILVAIVLVATGILVIVVAHQWPFTRAAVVQSLQEQSGSQVQLASFRQTFLPHPGCVAEGVTFRRGSGAATMMAIRQLTIVGSYPGLLTHHISTIRAEGLKVEVARQGGAAGAPESSLKIGSLNAGLTIGEIIADGAKVDVRRDPPHQSLAFRIPKLTIKGLQDDHPLAFQATVLLPLPPAQVEVAGKFGPWRSGNAGQTQLSGAYKVEHMDLGDFGGITGMLSSQGRFNGVLEHVAVQGSTQVPKFEVTESGHSLDLATEFKAVVNGLNGDVELEPAIAHFGKTTIVSTGSIAGLSQQKGAGKTVSLQIYSNQARIEDLLRMFVSEKKPAMIGSILFRGKVTVPPENRPFIDKVRLAGDFGISGAEYPHADTQRSIDVLSARARGEADKVEDTQDKLGNTYDPGRVLSNVKGHVALRDSVATLDNVSFDVPGASTLVSGTYKLKSEEIDLHGEMRLEAELSQATTGVKSFLLKVVQPLTSAPKHKGSIVHIKIGGTYQKPSYTVLPTTKSERRAAKALGALPPKMQH